MKKMLFVALILFLLPKAMLSIEYEPAQYVTKQTHLLRENESIDSVQEITLDGKAYYVLQILANKQLAGYLALERFEKKVVSDRLKLKRLFQTMEFVDLYTKFKKKVADNPSYVWFVLQSSQIPQIKQALETEKYELQTIADVMKSSDASEKVSNLTLILDQISSELENLKSVELDAVSFESEFLNSIKAGDELKLKDKMLSCYEKLEAIFKSKQQYETQLTLLRLDIANAQHLDIEEKKSLQKASEMPSEFATIDLWYSSAINIHFKENIENAYYSAVQNSLSFAEAVAFRIKRDECYRFIYEENDVLRKETNNEFLNLKQAYETIVSEKYYDKWVNQEQLKELKANWSRVNSALEKDDYDGALQYAKKAMNNAISVYRDGWISDNDNGINYDLVFKAIFALVLILIGLIGFRYAKRKGLFFFARSGENYEEVEIRKP